MLRNWSGVGGGGGDDNIPCTCTHVGCYATGQGCVGGGDDNIPCTCTHVGCYATGRGWSHSLFCTHVGCYATGQGWVGGGMITFLALAHMLDATQQVGDDNIPCFAHMLDATQLVRGGWGGGMITFLALAHMLDATQLVRGGWGGDDNIPCTQCVDRLWQSLKRFLPPKLAAKDPKTKTISRAFGHMIYSFAWRKSLAQFLEELSRVWWKQSSFARIFKTSKTHFF